MKEIIKTENAPAPIGPYSQAVRVGGFVFVSGQIPLNVATGKLIVGSIAKQTRQVMENLKAVLEQADSSCEQVVKTSIFLTSMDDFNEVNEVYGKYFNVNPPARETVEVNRLPKDVAVEISCIAQVKE
jgi:2-iminobutanoate/2-iminopropanoate deaminase